MLYPKVISKPNLNLLTKMCRHLPGDENIDSNISQPDQDCSRVYTGKEV